MVAQQELPPNWRDLQVYRLVKVEQRSTRGAAEVMQLSQTRVCQIVARVGEFFLKTAPAAAEDEEQRRRQLHVATQLAAERIEYLHKEAVNGFRGSQVEKVMLRKESVPTGKPEFDRRRTPGDPRFLMVAARLAMFAAKLPSPGMDFAALNADLMEDSAVDEPQELPNESLSPPKEACSPKSETTRAAAPDSSLTNAATSNFDESCVAGVSATLLAKLTSSRPVQRGSAEPGIESLRVARRAGAAPLAGPRGTRAREST